MRLVTQVEIVPPAAERQHGARQAIQLERFGDLPATGQLQVVVQQIRLAGRRLEDAAALKRQGRDRLRPKQLP